MRLLIIVVLLAGCAGAEQTTTAPSPSPSPVVSEVPSVEPSEPSEPSEEPSDDGVSEELRKAMEEWADPARAFDEAVREKCRDLSSSYDEYQYCLDVNGVDD